MAFTRTLCLLLIFALVPSGTYFAYADEGDTSAPASDTTVSAESAPSNSSASVSGSETSTSETTTSESTAADSSSEHTTSAAEVDDASASQTTTATSQETVTETHETTTGGGGSTGTSTPPSDTGSGSIDAAPAATSTPITEIATTSATTLGTTTIPSSGSGTDTASSSPVASTTISTGDATAGANIVNVAESNFVNSSGEVVLGNYFGSTTGVDLRTATSAFSTGALCLWFACSGSGSSTVILTGSSSLENLLTLSALTGDNLIGNASGSAAILSGDAFTGLNLVNLAGLNVIDSRYFIAALNFFQGLSGDLVFPSLAGFLDALASGAAPEQVTLDSNASVNNDVSFDVGTGENATTATSSLVTTGDARTLATILNQINSSYIGGANLGILLRITGAWNGEVFSAPEGLSVLRGADGSVYISLEGSRSAPAGTATLTASTTTYINNDIDLAALTGRNAIEGADRALIATGDAFAAANILNIANQNIIGRNWLTAVVNIFGDWNGNLAFGRPDLWVGERVEAPPAIVDGSELVFHFTVTNKGDAPATNASFAATLDSAHLELLEGTLERTLGTLAAGASTELTYRARVHAAPDTAIETSGSATAHETDGNATDNTDRVTLRTAGGSTGGTTTYIARIFDPRPKAPEPAPAVRPLEVTRVTTHVSTTRGGSVHEELIVRNPGNATSTPVDLHDLVKDPDGTVIDDEAWPLGSLAPHEEVRVSYDVAFDDSAPAGTYLLSTVLASDVTGDVEFRNNGSIEVFAGAVAGVTASAPVARPLSVTPPTVVRGAATTTPGEAPIAPAPLNPLLAAVANAHIPWSYALGFAAASGLLATFLGGILWMRRRFP